MDFRWASRQEKEFLRAHGLLTHGQMAGDVMVYRRQQVLKLLKEAYPDLWSTYKTARANGFPPKSPEPSPPPKTAATMASASRAPDVVTIRSMAARAAKQAARFNEALATERREERSACYDHVTQITHVPALKLRRLAPAAPRHSNRPVAVMAGQTQDGYVRLRTTEDVEAFVFYPRRKATDNIVCDRGFLMSEKE
jgi:hypothetical protein